MIATDIERLDWGKGQGLLPAIVQHADSGGVLMLGFMNRAALEQTLAEERVTFYSRTRSRLWTKGETSGNFIALVSAMVDCDHDSLLLTGRPAGPVCHTGAASCFHGSPTPPAARLDFLTQLEEIIVARISGAPESSYTARLHAQGTQRMAQKVGEEGLEVALAAVGRDDGALIAESADLLFHLLVLLKSRGHSLRDVVQELRLRHEAGESGLNR